MIHGFLKYIGRSTYPYLLFYDSNAQEKKLIQGAEDYLVDVLQSAPFSVFVTHLVLALFLYLSPLLFLISVRPFSYLAYSKRQKLISRLKNFRVYPVRLAFYGIRGHAFTAILRAPEARKYFGLQP